MKIVSFDIWDTILKRKCHPEEIKLHTAKHIWLRYGENLKPEYQDIYKIVKCRDKIEEEIGKEKQAQGFDAECHISEVFQRLQKEIRKKNEPNIVEELIQVELEQEKNMVMLNPAILPIFEKYKEYPFYCISDFYMGEKELKEILKAVSLPVTIKKIYSSADYLKNKKTGHLYQLVEQELNINPKEHLHVGDNLYSDIQQAQKLGIETIRIPKEKEEILLEKGRTFMCGFSQVKKKKAKTEKDQLFNIGVTLSPILYFFVYSIIEYAIQNKIPTIYYCTREGETFIKMHQLIESQNPFSCDVPKGTILEVSRMATFCASLKEFSLEELLRIWSQYQKGMSMKTLYRSLDVPIKLYQETIEKYGIAIEEPLEKPWKIEKVQKLFQDKEYIEKMNQEVEKKRKALFTYFQTQKDILNDDQPLFLVDIGWRGTIQDNIATIFSKKQVGGYYLALYPFYNKQPDNVYKLAFLKDHDILFSFLDPMITLMEWIYSPGTGSVIRYEENKVVRKAKDEELAVVEQYVKPMQEGMLEGAKCLNTYMKEHPYQAEEMVTLVYDIIRKIKTKPPKVLVNAYYNLVFNDTFGTNQYVEKNKKLSWKDKMNPIRCKKLLRNESWKEAFIVYYHVGYMKLFLGAKAIIKKLFEGK